MTEEWKVLNNDVDHIAALIALAEDEHILGSKLSA